MRESRPTDLRRTGFNRVVASCPPPPGLLVPADRGRQYPSEALTALLTRPQAVARRSRPGNPDDKALAKSGWRTLKPELLPRGAGLADRAEARLELAGYPDPYYHTPRLPAALGYCPPLARERPYRFTPPSLPVQVHPTTSAPGPPAGIGSRPSGGS